MRILTTWVLAVISLVLGIVISAVESKPREGGREISFLMKFEPGAVETFKLRRGGDEIVIRQQNGAWFFVSPDHEIINREAMLNLLNQLKRMRILDEISPGELSGELSLEKIGLTGDAALEIEIESRNGRKTLTETVTLGRPVSGTNHLYGRQGERNGVQIVSGNPLALLDSPYETLLEKKLVLAPPIAISQIAVKTARSEFAIRRRAENGQSRWEIAAPILARADQARVEDFLQQLLSLQIEDIGAGGGLNTVSIPNPLPEDALVIQYQIAGLPNPVVLYLKKEAQTDRFALPLFMAKSSDRPSSYLVRSQILDHIPSSIHELRIKTLGSFPERGIDSIAILEKPRMVLLTSNQGPQGSNWDVTLEDGSRVPANYAKIKDLIEQLNQPMILEFLEGDKKDFGIAPDAPGAIRLGLEFKIPGPVREDGSTAPDERISKVLDLGWKTDPQGVRQLFASFQDDDQIFRINEGLVALLTSQPVKWRSLRALRINQFHVTSLSRAKSGENLVIQFDKSQGTAAATIEGAAAPLDPISANMLRDRLATLEAATWVENPETAYEALAKPFVTFELEYDELNPATGQVRKASQTLRLTEYKSVGAPPENPPVIVGRVDNHPEVFILDRDTFRLLIRPVTGGTLNPAPQPK